MGESARKERKRKNKARREAQKQRSVQAYRRRAGLNRDEDEVPLASYFRRFFAFAIDQVLFLMFNLFVLLIVAKYYSAQSTLFNPKSPPLFVSFIPQLLFGAIYLVPLVAKRGQTLGSRRTKIILIREDGKGLLSWKQSFIRWFVSFGAPAVFAIALTIFSENDWVLFVVVSVFLLFPIAVSIPALWTTERQGIHDRLAGAVVVRQAPILAG